MEKIAKWIVKNRMIVLIVALAVTIASALLMLRVNIISDMTEYLPDDSSMKIGLEIMGEEFPNSSAINTIRVMFTDLPEEEKQTIKEELEQIPYADSVDYEADQEDYNKENYTLYVVNSSYNYGSKEMKSIEADIAEKYTGHYSMVYAVDDSTTSSVPMWILVFAVVLLTIILFVMCSSWAEPILFLITIGIAVVINMGTNAFLSRVSQTTYSIAAILQLVLSMDYSIMLMEHYRQELEKTEDHPAAMQHALAKSFAPVTSSSITTVVGLLMLVFMSFKIGADMGGVLAKGVLISLLCVFTVLPVLVLMFDKWVQKTEKKSPNIPMGKLGKFSFRFRYVITGVFALFFVGVMCFKGSTDIAYTMPTPSEIDEIFPKLNTIVMLYDNQDEDVVSGMLPELEAKDVVKTVNAYGNTLAKQYHVAELSDMMADSMGDSDSGMNLSSDLLGLVYYEYYEDGQIGELTLEELVQFLNDDLMTDETFAGEFDDEMKKKIEMFSAFCSKDELTKQRSCAELSDLFEMDEEQMSQVFSMTGRDTLSIQDFLQVASVYKNLAASFSSAGENDTEQLDWIQAIVSDVLEDKKYSAAEMAELFAGMSEEINETVLEMVYTFYYSKKNSDSDWTMSMEELINYVADTMAEDPKYASFLDEEMRTALKDAQTQINDGVRQLKGENYSILMLEASLPDESAETTAFLKELTEKCDALLSGEYYLIGNSPMAYEMSLSFGDEMNKITLLTAAAIFLVVMLTFRSVFVALILVLIIQTAVYATVVIMGIQGLSMYYLAFLIVQSILMGATIDYAILYTNYYRNARKEKDMQTALTTAYRGSINTILTSGLIIVIVTIILGYAFEDPSIGQICHTIAKGTTCSLILIVFILPGILATFDKLVTKR